MGVLRMKPGTAVEVKIDEQRRGVGERVRVMVRLRAFFNAKAGKGITKNAKTGISFAQRCVPFSSGPGCRCT